MPLRLLATSWICCWISTRLAVGSRSTWSPSASPPVISTRSRSLIPVSTGVGTSGHLTVELYKTLAKIDLAHVPYRNIGQSMSELMGGYIKLAMPTIPGALGHINAGKLRPLAVSGKARSSALPNVPTMAESGVAGYEASTWYAVLAPAAVSPEIVTKVNADIAQLLKAS